MYTVIHAILGYLFLLLAVRVLSRRSGAQMTPFEFVFIFLIGGVLIISTMGNDRSETNSVCAVIAVGLMHRLVSWLRIRFKTIGAVVDGTPLVALKGGQTHQDVMNNMRLDEMDLMAAARAKGLKSPSQIKYAILERNGAISIIKKEQ
jgi:uncharacterized membrane protein YcaP (DUF421 family)